VQWFDGSTEGHGRTEAQAVQALKLWSIVAPWPNPDPDNILAPFPAIAFRSWPLLDGNTSLPGCTWQETLNFADWTACIGTNPAILHTQSEGQANQGLGL
jgi:hypothetical protein